MDNKILFFRFQMYKQINDFIIIKFVSLKFEKHEIKKSTQFKTTTTTTNDLHDK
jgi:hypothetical protein